MEKKQQVLNGRTEPFPSDREVDFVHVRKSKTGRSVDPAQLDGFCMDMDVRLRLRRCVAIVFNPENRTRFRLLAGCNPESEGGTFRPHKVTGIVLPDSEFNFERKQVVFIASPPKRDLREPSGT